MLLILNVHKKRVLSGLFGIINKYDWVEKRNTRATRPQMSSVERGDLVCQYRCLSHRILENLNNLSSVSRRQKVLGNAAKHSQENMALCSSTSYSWNVDIRQSQVFAIVSSLLGQLGQIKEGHLRPPESTKRGEKRNMSPISGFPPIYSASLLIPSLIPMVAQKLDWIVR